MHMEMMPTIWCIRTVHFDLRTRRTVCNASRGTDLKSPQRCLYSKIIITTEKASIAGSYHDIAPSIRPFTRQRWEGHYFFFYFFYAFKVGKSIFLYTGWISLQRVRLHHYLVQLKNFSRLFLKKKVIKGKDLYKNHGILLKDVVCLASPILNKYTCTFVFFCEQGLITVCRYFI